MHVFKPLVRGLDVMKSYTSEKVLERTAPRHTMGWQQRRRARLRGGDGGSGRAEGAGQEPEEPCVIKDCSEFADKHLGGRSVSFQDAESVWSESAINSSGRRVRICRSCYKQLKKALKEELENRW